MDTHGGGWTLVVVSSDDDQHTWSWDNRHYWDTDTTTVGSVDSLNMDYKSSAFHTAPAHSLLFIHEPSGTWAAYDNVASTDLGHKIATYEAGADAARYGRSP